MSRIAPSGLFALVVLGFAGTGKAQDTTATKAEPPAAGAATAQAGRPTIPGANDVVATVTSHNKSDKITKGEVFNFLSRNPFRPRTSVKPPTRWPWTCWSIRPS